MQHLPEGVRLEDFTYENKKIAKILFDCVSNTSFQGVSVCSFMDATTLQGRVMFSAKGDRIAKTQIEQMQGDLFEFREEVFRWQV